MPEKGLCFVIDIDGTLCPIKKRGERYDDLVPFPEMVDRIRQYHEQGAKIILNTSRNMNSFNGNIGAINAKTAPVLLAWLEKWEIPYDEIYYGKPWPGHVGFYVDDRSVRPDEFLNLDLRQLEDACLSSRSRLKPAGMAIVVTMAGLGSRFRKEGWTCPKYMIEAKGRTLFEWSMLSLADYARHASRIVFVARREDEAVGFIREKSSALGLENVEILELDEQTDGQATTCYKAGERCRPDEALLVYNIDTYVEPGGLLFSDIAGDGHIPCFRGEGDHWSFARVDADGKVVEVREKERISDNCTLGAYYFSSVQLYRSLYERYYCKKDNIEQGEKYIAPLYNRLIADGGDVTISNVPNERVHVLGTPDELSVFMKMGE